MRRLALALVIAVSACAQPAQVAVDSSLTVETFADTGNEHFPDTEVQAILAGTSDFSYSTFPATSGPHAATWAPCGIYRETVPEIFDVHTMEHGGVVVHYDPSLPTDQRDSIENLARELGSHILVTPRPGLPAEVVLTAWTVMAAGSTANCPASSAKSCTVTVPAVMDRSAEASAYP